MKFLLGFSQVSVQIMLLNAVECVMSSFDLFVSCLQFQVRILKSVCTVHCDNFYVLRLGVGVKLVEFC